MYIYVCVFTNVLGRFHATSLSNTWWSPAGRLWRAPPLQIGLSHQIQPSKNRWNNLVVGKKRAKRWWLYSYLWYLCISFLDSSRLLIHHKKIAINDCCSRGNGRNERSTQLTAFIYAPVLHHSYLPIVNREVSWWWRLCQRSSPLSLFLLLSL